MADKATFHAKISADARQFIEQVQEATQSVNALISAYGEIGKQTQKATKNAGASSEAREAKKNVEDVYSAAQRLQKETSEQNLQNIKRENAERAKGAEGTTRGFSASPERSIAKAEFEAERMRKRSMDDRLKDHQTISSLFDQTIEMRDRDSKHFSQTLKNQMMERERTNLTISKAEQEDLRRVAGDNRKMMDAMVTGRYALYDVANAYRQIGQAGIQATKALSQTVMVAMQFESAFTSVERALKLDYGSKEFLKVRDILTELSTTIPSTFAEITDIATLGAQMGIEVENIKEFTETVAKFTTVTGISIDEASEKFGRLAALAKVPTEEFENLGSAVLFAGFNAVATESDILRVSESIAAAANKSGFAAKEVVGLATALASLGIQPELSRGALTRVFAKITDAVEGSSGKLREFAEVAGVATGDAQALFRTDPEQFFSKFLKGLGTVDSLTEKFRELGIVNVRDIDVVTRLANNYDVYTKSINDANDSYTKGSALAEYYAKTVDDLEQKIQLLKNSFEALFNELGKGAAEGLKVVVDGIKVVVDAAADFAKSDIAKFAVPFLLIATTAVAAFGMFTFAINIAKAQLLAMQVATIKMAQLNGTWAFSFKNVIQQLRGAVFSVTMQDKAVKLLTKSQMEAAVAAGTLSQANMNTALTANRATFAVRALTVATAGFGVLAVASIITTIGGVLFSMAKEAELFGENIEKAAERTAELGRAGVAAAGGMDAFNRAMRADESSKRVDSLDELWEAQDKVNKALQIGITGYGDYEKAVAKGRDIDLDVAREKGEEYRNLLIESVLGTVDPETGLSFINRLLGVDATAKAALESIGFDYVKLVEASFAEGAGGTGAQDYVDNLLKSIEVVLSGKLGSGFREEFAEFGNLADSLGLTFDELAKRLKASGFKEFIEAAKASAKQVDATNKSVDLSIEQQIELARTTAVTGESAEDAAARIEELNKQLQLYISEVGKAEGATQDAALSFENFAAGINETGEGLTGFTKESQTNLKNWQTFVKNAFEAAAASGRGTVGGILDVVAALAALEAAGKDTTETWELTRNLVVSSLEDMGGQYAVLAGLLASAPDLAALRSIVAGFLTTAEASGGLTAEIAANISAILAVLGGNGADFDKWAAIVNAAFNRVRAGSSRVKTALEKLKESVDSVFALFDRDIRLGDSIRRFGALLEQNGKTFNRFTEAGARNVSGLQSIINELAEQSGGNVQKFANSLATLREALVRTGVGASGLRFIDDQIRKIGVTGTVSANQANRFFHILRQGAASAAEELKGLVGIVNDLQNSIRTGLQNRFAFTNAIDDITLGWLDMSEAAEAAKRGIDSARESIERANQSIREAQATISGLVADKSKLEYQLQIAVKYGDTIRANQIRADLEKIDADIARQQENIGKSQSDIAKSYDDIREAEGRLGLEPSTRQIIERNRALQDMAGKYGNVAAWMMATAEEGADLNAIVEAQIEAFRQNAIQLGYTEAEADAVATVLREELLAAMIEIPKDIQTTINADTSGAMRSINSFVADANSRLAQIRDKTVIVTTINRSVTVSPPTGGGAGGFLYAARGGLISGPGTPTSDSIGAMLSNGEYVVQASAVKHYGVDFFNALNQMSTLPAAMMPAPVSTSGGEQMVYLSPEDRQLLRAAIDRPIALYTDNATIAKSANAGNQVLAQRGAN